MKKILITGANGMIGTAIVHELINGYELILVDKNTDKIHQYADRLTVINEDITDICQWQVYLSNVFCVVHLAAQVHFQPQTLDEENKFIYTNAESTRILYDFCTEHNVERFLFFSTNDVYEPSDELITEQTPVAPQGIYGKSKYLAEQYLLNSSTHKKPTVCIFRPASVFGENDRGSMKTLVGLCRNGIVPMIGKGGNRKALLYVKDVARAVNQYISSSNDHDKEVFNISSGDFTYKQIIDTICSVYGYNPMHIYVPNWFCTQVASRINPIKKLSVAAENKTISTDKAHEVLGYIAEYSLSDGLLDSQAYYVGQSIHG